MSAGAMASWIGGVLVIVGIIMVGYQMTRVSWSNPPNRSVEFGKKGIALKTTYPGLILVGIGAVLLMTAAIAN